MPPPLAGSSAPTSWARSIASRRSPDGAARGARAQPSGRVTDGFDVVAVGVEHERAVVILVIVGARSGRTVVAAACRQSGSVELVYLLAALGAECDVNARLVRLALGQPEVGLGRDAVPADHDAAR